MGKGAKISIPITKFVEVGGSVTNDTYFGIKEDPLEQQILPLLDQATDNHDVNAALKLIKIEAHV